MNRGGGETKRVLCMCEHDRKGGLLCVKVSDDEEVPYTTLPVAVVAEKTGADVDPTQVTVTEPVPPILWL